VYREHFIEGVSMRETKIYIKKLLNNVLKKYTDSYWRGGFKWGGVKISRLPLRLATSYNTHKLFSSYRLSKRISS